MAFSSAEKIFDPGRSAILQRVQPGIDFREPIRAFLQTRIRTLLIATRTFRMRWIRKFAFSGSEIQTESASRTTALKDTGKNAYTTIAAPKFRTLFHTPMRKSLLTGGLIVSFILAVAFAWSWVSPMVSTQVNEKNRSDFRETPGPRSIGPG